MWAAGGLQDVQDTYCLPELLCGGFQLLWLLQLHIHRSRVSNETKGSYEPSNKMRLEARNVFYGALIKTTLS